MIIIQHRKENYKCCFITLHKLVLHICINTLYKFASSASIGQPNQPNQPNQPQSTTINQTAECDLNDNGIQQSFYFLYIQSADPDSNAYLTLPTAKAGGFLGAYISLFPAA